MPQHHMVIPHYMGMCREMDVEKKNVEKKYKIKQLDSFSSRSSFQDIPLLLPQDPDGLESSNEESKLNGFDSSVSLLEQPTRVSRSISFSFRKSKTEPVPDMPMKGFVDDLDTLDLKGKMSSDVMAQPGMRTSDREWWETQERGNQVLSVDETGQVGPCIPCRCQVG